MVNPTWPPLIMTSWQCPVEYSSQVVHLIMQEVTEEATNETMPRRMMSLTDLMSKTLRLSSVQQKTRCEGECAWYMVKWQQENAHVSPKKFQSFPYLSTVVKRLKPNGHKMLKERKCSKSFWGCVNQSSCSVIIHLFRWNRVRVRVRVPSISFAPKRGAQ